MTDEELIAQIRSLLAQLGPTLAQVIANGRDAEANEIDSLIRLVGPTGGSINAPRAELDDGKFWALGGNDGENPSAAIILFPAAGAAGLIGIIAGGNAGNEGDVLTAQGDGTAKWQAPT